jgi:hypothetical protein
MGAFIVPHGQVLRGLVQKKSRHILVTGSKNKNLAIQQHQF